jgi:hypothetical protein
VERVIQHPRAATNVLTVPPPAWHGALRRLAPLWRHAVWLVSLLALIALWVDIRVDVQQLRTDLSRSGRAYRQALQENEHLRLEVETRRRALAMEQAGAALGLVGDVELVDVRTPVAPVLDRALAGVSEATP